MKGTHVIGTALGSTKLIKKKKILERYIGVSPNSKFIACKSMDDGWAKLSNYIECFDFFFAPTGILYHLKKI
jgi:serine protease AprX